MTYDMLPGHADAAHDPPPPEQLPQPIDLRQLLDGEPPEQEWLVEPLIVARRHTGIVSKRGEGKSLFVLDIAAAKATGAQILDQPEGDPIHVVYIDQEMGSEDLYDRLSDLGYTTDHPKFDALEAHLHYYQLIDLEPLNTPEGGETIEAIVELHSAELLAIDTLSKVVTGDENAAEPYQELWNHTEKRLKRRGNLTYIRNDHLGKDAKRGSRGASAKEDNLDIVYELKVGSVGTLFFNKTKGRQPWLPETVKVDRATENGILRHRTEIQLAEPWLLDLVAEIDELGLPADAGSPTIQKALQAENRGRRRADIAKAVRFRKGREHPPQTDVFPGTSEQSGTPNEKTDPDQGKQTGNTHGNTPEQVDMGSVPPLGGEHPHPSPSLTFDEETERIAP